MARKPRKSQVANSINSSSPGTKLVWQVVIVCAFIGAMVMMFAGH